MSFPPEVPKSVRAGLVLGVVAMAVAGCGKSSHKARTTTHAHMAAHHAKAHHAMAHHAKAHHAMAHHRMRH